MQLDINKYDVVDDDISTSMSNTNKLIRVSRWYGSRFQMGALILVGVVTMICHAAFCTYLSGHEVNTGRILGLKLTQQVIVSAMGNAIASFATFVLGMAVGIAVVQILWTYLHRNSYSIQNIEAMLSCPSRPFSPSAMRAWRAAWLLSAVAALGSGMRLITIFAPGALRSETASIQKTCTIQKVDFSNGNYGVIWPDNEGNPTLTPSPKLNRMVVQNLVSGSYIAPPNYCGDLPCTYSMVFNAPAMNCTNITSQFNFTNMRLETPTVIWNVTNDIGPYGSSIAVATMEANDVRMEAANCTVYNATFSVDITHNVTLAIVDVKNIDIHQPVDKVQLDAADYMSTYTTAMATANILSGLGQVDMRLMQNVISKDDPQAYNPYVIFSSLGQPGPQNSMTWEWNWDMLDAFPQLMTNISISLLSNPVNAPLSSLETQCVYSKLVYVYDQYHLLLAYVPAILVALTCVIAGFRSVERNGREETLEFSRLLIAILSPGLVHEELRKTVLLKARQDEPDGCSKFFVESSSYDQ